MPVENEIFQFQFLTPMRFELCKPECWYISLSAAFLHYMCNVISDYLEIIQVLKILMLISNFFLLIRKLHESTKISSDLGGEIKIFHSFHFNIYKAILCTMPITFLQ